MWASTKANLARVRGFCGTTSEDLGLYSSIEREGEVDWAAQRATDPRKAISQRMVLLSIDGGDDAEEGGFRLDVRTGFPAQDEGLNCAGRPNAEGGGAACKILDGYARCTMDEAEDADRH